jgi:hypothetical protein
LWTVALALAAVSGCATVRPPSATLAVRCNVPDASLVVDDTPVGQTAAWAPPGHPLPAGFHRLEIRHPSYYSHYAEVTLAPGASASLSIDLHPLLD